MRIERIVLEHHRNSAVLRGEFVDHFAANRDVARGDCFQAGNHPQRRALAATGRPDEHDEFIVRDVEIDRADGFDISELLDDLVQGNFGHDAQPLVAPAVSPAM